MSLDLLIKDEGWKIYRARGEKFIVAEGKRFPYTHPAMIHQSLYGSDILAEGRCRHMVKAHHYFWPEDYWTWDHWSEWRYREHCENWRFVALTSGANTGKSYTCAKIGVQFWSQNPTERAVTIASVTSESLKGRVWGYLTDLIFRMKVKIPYKYTTSPNPKVLYDRKIKGRFEIKDDTLHGIFAVTAKPGDSATTISTWIGRHPKDKAMVVLDECTDMPMAVHSAVANLDQNEGDFQLWALGNANKKTDLHGALCTPKNGWSSIDPTKTNRWETTQERGICCYFNPEESPAILETDPIKRKKLEKYFPTQAKLARKKREWGENSDEYWRMVRGLWRVDGTSDEIISEAFLKDYDITRKTFWSGLYPVKMCAGLDPGFSTKGDACILRLARMGHTLDGSVVLDFGGEELVFKIPIVPGITEPGLPFSPERQVAQGANRILKQYGIPLSNVAIDATGQGRGIAEIMRLLNENPFQMPWKITSVRKGTKKKTAIDLTPIGAYELYDRVKNFITHDQIVGLDKTTVLQMQNRLIVDSSSGDKTLETKQDFKSRMKAIMPSLAHSPDHADAAALCVQAAVLSLGFVEGLKWDNSNILSDDPKVQAVILEQLRQKQAQRKIPQAKFSKNIADYAKYRGGFTKRRARGFSVSLYSARLPE